MTIGSDSGSGVTGFPTTSSVSPQSPAWLTPELKKLEGRGDTLPLMSAAGSLWFRAANLSLPSTPQCYHLTSHSPTASQPHRPMSLDSQSMENSPHLNPKQSSGRNTVNSGPEGGVRLKDSPVQGLSPEHLSVVPLRSPYHCSRP